MKSSARLCLDMVFKHIAGTSDPFGAKTYPHYVLIELSGQGKAGALRGALEETLAAAAAEGAVLDAVFADSIAQARAFWRIREATTEAQKFEGGSIKSDVSVPVSRVAEFIAAASAACAAALPGVRLVTFGHVGDGNIHFNLSQPLAGLTREEFLGEWDRMNRIVHDIVAAMGGSFSAEHGIGRVKRHDLTHYRSPVELDLMRKLKATLDPQGLMNPGKVL